MSHESVQHHNREQRHYFEGRVPKTMVPQATPYVRRHVEMLLETTGLARDEPILEVGCGMGNYTFELVRRGYAVEGLDLSPVLLERLRTFAGDEFVLPLHCADVLDPPAELFDRFAGVVGFFTLHHLHDLPAALSSMTRLLRAGGRLAFVEPNAFNPLYYVQIAATRGMSFRGERHLTDMRPAVVLPALREAGLVDVVARRYGFFPPQIVNHELGRKVEATLERVRPLLSLSAFHVFGGTLA